MCECEIRSLGASYRRVPRRSWYEATFHHELLRLGEVAPLTEVTATNRRIIRQHTIHSRPTGSRCVL